MTKVKAGYRRVYRFPLVERLFILVFIGTVAIIMGFLFSLIVIVFFGYWIGGIFSIYFLLMILTGIWSNFKRRLIVGEKGITVYSPGVRFIPYENMYYLRTTPTIGRTRGKYFGIELKSGVSANYSRAQRLLMPLLAPYRQIIFDDDIYFVSFFWTVKVPLKMKFFSSEIDIEKFKKTDFGQDLYHYAPHLFEDVERHKR